MHWNVRLAKYWGKSAYLGFTGIQRHDVTEQRLPWQPCKRRNNECDAIKQSELNKKYLLSSDVVSTAFPLEIIFMTHTKNQLQLTSAKHRALIGQIIAGPHTSHLQWGVSNFSNSHLAFVFFKSWLSFRPERRLRSVLFKCEVLTVEAVSPDVTFMIPKFVRTCCADSNL